MPGLLKIYYTVTVLSFLQQVVQLQAAWRTVQCQAVEMIPEPDDDTSLYRLFGFSLFAAIRFRKTVVYGRLRKKFTRTKCSLYMSQLQALKSLLETDKSCLPACIRYQREEPQLSCHSWGYGLSCLPGWHCSS